MKQQKKRSYSPADEDFRLWRFLGHTSYSISRLRELELAQYSLTPEQAYVLDILSVSDGSTTIGKIMDMTLRPHNTVSTLVARMVQHGLVEKRHSSNDKRRYDIIITRKGEELFRKVTRDSITMAFSTLSVEDKRALGSILSRLLSRAYEMNGKQFNFTQESVPCST